MRKLSRSFSRPVKFTRRGRQSTGIGDIYFKAQPGSRGRVIISETSRAKYNRRLRAILSELKVNGVTSSRITSIYKTVRPNRALESVELWIIPARAR